MSQLVSLPNPGNSNRRRFGRFAVAVPVDVVVLRSGVPSTIPGRSVDVGEGGVSAVLAGELQPGEAIGISLQLPFVLEPVQAKAVVRHHMGANGSGTIGSATRAGACTHEGRRADKGRRKNVARNPGKKAAAEQALL